VYLPQCQRSGASSQKSRTQSRMTDLSDSGTKRTGKGYYYVVTEEKIKWWQSIPPEQKLEWLEEANNFLAEALSPEKRRVMELFRKGEI
jgi:hypothetical protein